MSDVTTEWTFATLTTSIYTSPIAPFPTERLSHAVSVSNRILFLPRWNYVSHHPSPPTLLTDCKTAIFPSLVPNAIVSPSIAQMCSMQNGDGNASANSSRFGASNWKKRTTPSFVATTIRPSATVASCTIASLSYMTEKPVNGGDDSQAIVDLNDIQRRLCDCHDETVGETS